MASGRDSRGAELNPKATLSGLQVDLCRRLVRVCVDTDS